MTATDSAAFANDDRAARLRHGRALVAMLLLATLALTALSCADLIVAKVVAKGVAKVGTVIDRHMAGADLLWDVRLPRVLGAWAAGACLGLGGALAQSLFRNPLADPYLVGSASGAGLGVALSLVLLGSVRIEFAFAGALLAVALAVTLSRGGSALLLAGFVISIVLSATVAMLLVQFPEHLRVSQLFMLGQTHLLDWPASMTMIPILVLALLLVSRWARALEALSLGDLTARSLGLPVTQLRWLMIAVIALLSAVSVTYCGMLAFVGLGAAHMVRAMFKRAVMNHLKLQLILSALVGGSVLQGSDLIARLLFWPTEMPVGIVTALSGGGYLLFLLSRQR